MKKRAKPLRHLYSVTAKGRTYHYAWRGGPRIVAEPGSPEFAVEYAEHHKQRQMGDADRMAALCAQYRASYDWTVRASDKTRSNWSPWLDKIQKEFGQLPVAAFGQPLIKEAIRNWHHGFAAHPRSADVGLEVLSRLLTYAVDGGKLSVNPVFGMKRLYKTNRAERIWTAEDLARLQAHASAEVYQAAKLASLTGLRTADLLGLCWSGVKAHAIERITNKSGQRITAIIPLYPELKEYLETIPKRSTTILVNSDGHPWRTGFASSFGKAKKKAGLTGLHFHDLRGTAATRYFLGDISIREIAEICGWSEDQVDHILKRYVKKDAILIDRIRRMENAAGTENAKLSAKPSGVG
jgi:hypothetical protein